MISFESAPSCSLRDGLLHLSSRAKPRDLRFALGDRSFPLCDEPPIPPLRVRPSVGMTIQKGSRKLTDN